MKGLRKPASIQRRPALLAPITKRGPFWLVVAVTAIAVVAAAFKVSLADASHVAPFVGSWQNDDAATRDEKRAVIGPRTTPQSDAADGQLSIVWEFGFARRTETLTLLPDGRLHITGFTQFLDGSGRRDYWSNEDFHKTTAPAVFHTFGVAVVGAGRGKITSSPAGLDCPDACSLEFESGTSVVLTARPDSGSRFAGWSGACTGVASTCTVAVGGDTTATALFGPSPRCVVPALARKTLAGARRALTSAHCRLAAMKRAYSRRVRSGRVLAQTPAAGRKLPNGGGVSVVISRGPRRENAGK
jgi:hypothetical protein